MNYSVLRHTCITDLTRGSCCLPTDQRVGALAVVIAVTLVVLVVVLVLVVVVVQVLSVMVVAVSPFHSLVSHPELVVGNHR